MTLFQSLSGFPMSCNSRSISGLLPERRRVSIPIGFSMSCTEPPWMERLEGVRFNPNGFSNELQPGPMKHMIHIDEVSIPGFQ